MNLIGWKSQYNSGFAGLGKWWLNLREVETENTEVHFAFCLNNKGYPDDLKVRTIYRVLADESAARSNYIRIVDKTGEDYLYPTSRFVLIDLLTKHTRY